MTDNGFSRLVTRSPRNIEPRERLGIRLILRLVKPDKAEMYAIKKKQKEEHSHLSEFISRANLLVDKYQRGKEFYL